jgi:L-alanine-DL-glutamate epimerase-like enolase superfamily enzyme
MTAITKLETIHYSLPFETGGPRVGMRPALRDKDQAWLRMDCLMLRIETEEGLSGWGEAFGHMVIPGTDAVIRSMVPKILLGRDSRAISRRVEEIERPFHGFGRSGPLRYALSAIDIALWDLAGQRAGLPLFRMLGGDSADLTRYASLMRYGGDTDAVARNVSRAADAGFTTIKLHEQTLPAFMAAREAVSAETRIGLDVNCPWTVAEALAIARAIADHDFGWLEEPIWPPEDVAAIAEIRHEGVPIAAGENLSTLHDFKAAFEAGALDIVQPSVTKVGGISAMMRILALARAYPVRVVPHCFYWGPGYHATAHVAASQTTPLLVETAFIDVETRPHALFDVSTAGFTLPETPGLGFDADWDGLEPYVVDRWVATA